MHYPKIQIYLGAVGTAANVLNPIQITCVTPQVSTVWGLAMACVGDDSEGVGCAQRQSRSRDHKRDTGIFQHMEPPFLGLPADRMPRDHFFRGKRRICKAPFPLGP